MRRAIALLAFATMLAVLPASPAIAHPLGNFTVNHLTEVGVTRDAVELRYILDVAEIPTFQARHQTRAETLQRAQDEVARGLIVTIDGRRVALRGAGTALLSYPRGQAGLNTTRIELSLRAAATGAAALRVDDGTYPDRLGYTALVARPGAGTAVRSSVPSDDPTNGLRRYPPATIKRPLDERSATLTVREGDATLIAPRAGGGDLVTTRSGGADGFAGVFEDAAAGRTTLAFLLLAALGWGALHALSPGHGKGMVAAYLVGAKGTSRHAAALGAVVTVTHTIGVFALGLVTLLLAQYVLPEDLYPWLTLASGLMIVAIGGVALRARIGRHREQHAHSHDDSHVHGDGHIEGRGDGHEHGNGPDHHHDHGPNGHRHEMPDAITWKGLITLGASAGLIPCPTALVVLLGAIAQHQVVLGLGLIVVFSIGLAATLTALGLLVVHASRLTARLRVPGRLVSGLPAASAVVIVALGCLLTLQAVPKLV